MPTATIKTFSGERQESWPDTMGRAQSAIADARGRYALAIAKNHTLDLLGLSEALALELAFRKPGIDAMQVNTDIKPRRRAHV